MLRLFRPVNLLIVGITQYLLHYLVLVPALQSAGQQPSLDGTHFFLLVLTTVLIAAGGYVINDLMDETADRVNKPEKIFVGKYLSHLAALQFYGFITLLGAGIAWYLAGHVGRPTLFGIYPGAVLLLYLYSFWLKKIPLWGNLVVSLFCAGVAGIVLFSEREAYWEMAAKHPGISQKIMVVFGAYIAFAFISTFLREIIKDLEDLEGDRMAGLQTFPLKYGIRTAQKLCCLVAFLLLAGLAIAVFWLQRNGELPGLIFTATAIIGPVLYLLHLLPKSTDKPTFTALSRLSKWIMVSGLLLLIVIWKY